MTDKKQMRTSTKRMLEDILRDYPELPKYIKLREEELHHPTPEKDDNIGGGRALNKISNPVERLVLTIDDDRRLNWLKQEQMAIDDCLDESGEITTEIIDKLYFHNYNNATIRTLVNEGDVPVSYTKGYQLLNDFLFKLAKKLNIDVL